MLPWFCAGDAVCTGAVVAVSFGAGVEVAAGAFVLATGAAGSVRFGVCATGFGSVFTVACGFRFNHRLLASWTRSGRTFSGLRFRRVTRCIAIANRRDRRGFSRQRGIDRHIIQLLLILWLGQRIVQVTLHFNTLLTIRCRRVCP